jgi:hypothetical protein
MEQSSPAVSLADLEPKQSMNQPPKASIGRIVHFVIPDGQHRPAIVVRVWPDEYGPGLPGYNLQVFTDDRNDGLAPVLWRTSVKLVEGSQPGTCHWPERE